jgi:hypothetical protein
MEPPSAQEALMKPKNMASKLFSNVPRVLARAALVALAIGTLDACSLLYDLSTEQCSQTSDCGALGAAFSEYVCVNHLCRPSTDAGYCDTNASCLDAPDNPGDPAICTRKSPSDVGKSCVYLKTAECPLVLPNTRELWRENLRSDNVLILGGFGTIPTEQTGMQIRNYDLALTELTSQIGGLPGSGGSRRPVVMVLCRANFTERTELDASMTHLADTLKVPGIVSGLLADDLQYAFESKGLGANMFFMSPLESDSTLTSLQDDGLLWHVGPGGTSVGRAYAPLLERTLSYLNVSGPVRVASVLASDLRLLSDIDAVVRSPPSSGGISFNGMSVFENLNADNYKSVAITSVYTDPNVQLATQSQDILAFKPHVIIGDAADEFLDQMVPAIERGWAAAAGTQPRPFYLLSPIHYNNPALPRLLLAFPDVWQRLIGVNAPSAVDQVVYEGYQTRFNGAYPEVANRTGYENFYDAIYYLMYAAAGARNLLVSGQDMKRGMTQLLSGPRFDVGPTPMPQAMQSLGNASISLYGTLGAPTFDPSTGARGGVGSAWCVTQSKQQKADVLRYDDASKAMVGNFPCFPGF